MTPHYPGTTSLSSYFGYSIKSIMSWEGEVMVTANHITDPYGTTKVRFGRPAAFVPA